MRYLTILVFLLTLPGCFGGLPAVVRELAKDTATACVTVTSIYGVVRLYRTNVLNATVSCTPDGMTVTSAPKLGAP
jgi:hypothetical protein